LQEIQKKRRGLVGRILGLAARLPGVWILAWPLWAVAAPPDAVLTPALDLQAEARAAARSGFPLVLMFSREDCIYCKGVRRDYLVPLNRMPEYAQVQVRQIDQDRNTPLRDFQGQPTTHADFAAREGIRLVPVVSFYGPDGRQVAESIVGARLPDFYQSYLESALRQGAAELSRKPVPGR